MPTTTTTREPITTTTNDITTAITTTIMPPTTGAPTDGPNIITDSSTLEDTVTTNKPAIEAQANTGIPDEVSILFIVIASVCFMIVLSVLALFSYKKCGNNRKRKISSVLPLGEAGSTVIEAHHGGVLKCEDIETQSVKFRSAAQN
jgi:hypothetical protein